ncbi:hypothetical protein AgCh_015898 [Apium graveolens]
MLLRLGVASRTAKASHFLSSRNLEWNLWKGEVNGFYCKASSDKSLAMALEALTLEHQLKELFCEKRVSERTASSGIQKDEKCEAFQKDKSKTTSHKSKDIP